MRRRVGSVDNFAQDNLLLPPGTPREKVAQQRSRYLRSPGYQRLLAHPAVPLLVFVLLFPALTLGLHLWQLCSQGELPLCRSNDPEPDLSRPGLSITSLADSYTPNYRGDLRCGVDYPAPNGDNVSVCDPFSKQYCCSQWGWCGRGRDYCVQALHKPYNDSRKGGCSDHAA